MTIPPLDLAKLPTSLRPFQPALGSSADGLVLLFHPRAANIPTHGWPSYPQPFHPRAAQASVFLTRPSLCHQPFAHHVFCKLMEIKKWGICHLRRLQGLFQLLPGLPDLYKVWQKSSCKWYRETMWSTQQPCLCKYGEKRPLWQTLVDISDSVHSLLL